MYNMTSLPKRIYETCMKYMWMRHRGAKLGFERNSSVYIHCLLGGIRECSIKKETLSFLQFSSSVDIYHSC